MEREELKEGEKEGVELEREGQIYRMPENHFIIPFLAIAEIIFLANLSQND